MADTDIVPGPFFRIVNPVTQGEKFDPDGDYARGYPGRIVDHVAERAEALGRYEAIR